MSKQIYAVGDHLVCVNTDTLRVVGEDADNKCAPPLEKEKEYVVESIVLDSKGNQHLNVGLKSMCAWIRSIDTGEDLPDGERIHWCHPSRFVPVSEFANPV